MLEETKLIQYQSLHAGSKVRFTEKPKVSFMDLIALPKRIHPMGPEAQVKGTGSERDVVEVMVVDMDEREAGVGDCQTSP